MAIATPRPDKSEDADPENAARIIALRLLERQPRTRAELAQALARRGVPADAATAVLDRFTEVGLIDDEAFASAWVQSRHTGRNLGRRALSAELRRRGVADEVVRDAVDVVSDEDEAIAARALVARKLPAMAGVSYDAKMRRLIGMLARKGFNQRLAMTVVRQSLAQAPTDPVD